MSEPQTEHETDAEPTPGPWEVDCTPGVNHGVVWSQDDKAVAVMGVCDELEANAEFIAAAGTAAQEAKEMGYDAQRAVEALPKILEALEDTAEMMAHLHVPGHAARRAKVHNALASAEGSGDE